MAIRQYDLRFRAFYDHHPMIDRHKAKFHARRVQQFERHLPTISGPAADADLRDMLLQPIAGEHVVERDPAAGGESAQGVDQIAPHLIVKMQAVDKDHIEPRAGIGGEPGVAGHAVGAAPHGIDADFGPGHYRVEQLVARAADLEIPARRLMRDQQIDQGRAGVGDASPVAVEHLGAVIFGMAPDRRPLPQPRAKRGTLAPRRAADQIVAPGQIASRVFSAATAAIRRSADS